MISRMRILLATLCISFSLFSASPPAHSTCQPFEPWLVGSFLAPSANNLNPRQFSFFGFVLESCQYGLYDSNWKYHKEENLWVTSFCAQYTQGLTEKLGFEVIGTYSMRYSDGESTKGFNDTLLTFGYQVSTDDPNSWVPDFRIWISSILPTGQFQGSRRNYVNGLGFAGQGALFLGPTLVWQKKYIYTDSALVINASLAYKHPFRTSVSSVSVYGGGIGVDGSIVPGQLINGNISLEYSLSQRWALTSDIFITHQLKTSGFRGFPGLTLEGNLAQIGLPSSTQLSLTPSIEYSFNAKAGLLLGSWVSFAGQNAPAFAGVNLCLSVIF